MKRILIAALAATGLGAGHLAASAQQVQQRSVQQVNQATKTPSVEFDRFARGMALAGRKASCSPKDWGMSSECARMVRHNRLRAHGLGGQHI